VNGVVRLTKRVQKRRHSQNEVTALTLYPLTLAPALNNRLLGQMMPGLGLNVDPIFNRILFMRTTSLDFVPHTAGDGMLKPLAFPKKIHR
jgi:hypothetical protein